MTAYRPAICAQNSTPSHTQTSRHQSMGRNLYPSEDFGDSARSTVTTGVVGVPICAPCLLRSHWSRCSHGCSACLHA
jgi:hypothetical protein